MKTRIILLSLLLCGFASGLQAQVVESDSAVPDSAASDSAVPYTTIPDSAVLDSVARLPTSMSFLKKATYSLAGIAGVNLGIWGINRYVLRANFSSVNSQTIRYNLKSKFVWDNDLFGTNNFLHPLHGALYYQVTRACGFNFYASIPYIFAGSLMWEYLMENEQPSINDLISTTVGGIGIGEVVWRIYDRTFNRSRAHRDRTPIAANVSLGGHLLKPEMNANYHPYLQLAADLTYNPDRSECEKPYGWFELGVRVNIGRGRIYINQFHLSGLIWNKVLKETDTETLDVGLYQQFDYLDAPVKVYSQTPYRMAQVAAFGLGVQYDRKERGGFSLNGQFFLTGVGLGAYLSDYYWVVDRDYNFGSGFSSALHLVMADEGSGLRLKTRFNYYRLFTWKGYAPERNLHEEKLTKLDVQGDKGAVNFTHVEAAFGYQSKNGWNLYLVPAYIHRSNTYAFRPNVTYSAYEFIFKVGYLFQFPQKK